MNRIRRGLTYAILALPLMLLLGACGLQLPRDIGQYAVNCERFSGDVGQAPDNAMFFMSSRQRDCRGDALRFANLRGTSPVFGEIELQPQADEPWKGASASTFAFDKWIARVKARLSRGDNAGRLLIYVHGFYNDYDTANERARILSQLNWRGVPVVVIHWPSRHRYQSYAYDEDSVQWAQDFLDQTLRKLAPEASDITIVGHSMGTRAVLAAVDRLDRTDQVNAPHVGKVVLASPDIDREQALRSDGLIDRLLDTPGRQILIYASFKDRALKSSRFVHGYDRLGSSDCRNDVDFRRRTGPDSSRCSVAAANPRLAIVDTSQVDSKGLVNHSDFVDSCFVQQDLAEFLRSGEGRPAQYPWRKEEKVGQLTGYSIVEFSLPKPEGFGCNMPDEQPKP